MNNKKTVLITGASTGIGYELAKLFARDNYNLILVARSKEKLEKLAEELTAKYNCLVTVIKKDLSNENSAMELFQEVSSTGFEVDVLVNNAGVGSCGLFHETNLEKDIEIINVNITSLTVLTKLFSEKMVKKGGGKILNVASTGAYTPGPYIATYYATKAYVLSLSEALSNELKDFGVTVTVLCPGATRTEFANRAGRLDAKNAMSPKFVAEIAYKGLLKNKRVVIPGGINKVAVGITKILPRKLSANYIGKMQKKLFSAYKKTSQG